MTAKAISKRIKAKGLGRLRWYCQMCEKQCRDENGFKCHTQSAGHQRQLALFSENPTEFISNFSYTFQREFLSILRQRYGNSFVNANTVYQDYIKDKDHVHMNATKWTTLTEFVKDIGKEGLCKVQEKDDGFWVSFVDREVAEKDRQARERDVRLLEEEHRTEIVLQHQIRNARTSMNMRYDPDESEHTRNDFSSEPVQMKISNRNRVRLNKAIFKRDELSPFFASTRNNKDDSREKGANQQKQRRSRWDDVEGVTVNQVPNVNAKVQGVSDGPSPEKHEISSNVYTENISGQSEEQSIPWVCKNIIVKVKNNTVGNGAYYKKKGKIIGIVDDYGARVAMLDSGAVLELDQDDLETVIPKAGGLVMLLSGKYRGQKAVVKRINVDSFNVSVMLSESGEELQALEYETVSRLSV